MTHFYKIEYGSGCGFLPDSVDYAACCPSELLDGIDPEGNAYPTSSLGYYAVLNAFESLAVGDAYWTSAARCTVYRISEAEFDSAYGLQELLDS